ncbi:hypothetical protein HPSNAG_0833 [Glaesserella parasuis str. Nagasaki]|nr:hypothetical protein HPSNAG_0833 [Glaesserella parasuis str. Nagasaki]
MSLRNESELKSFLAHFLFEILKILYPAYKTSLKIRNVLQK